MIPHVARPVPITDPADDRLADYIGLRDAALRDRRERDEGIFIAEGKLVIRRLADSPYPIRSLLLTPERRRDLVGDVHQRDIRDGAHQNGLHLGNVGVCRAEVREQGDQTHDPQPMVTTRRSLDTKGAEVPFSCAEVPPGCDAGPRVDEMSVNRA